MSDRDIQTVTITDRDGEQVTFVAVPTSDIPIGEAMAHAGISPEDTPAA